MGLADWIRKLITEVRWCTSEWTICDLHGGKRTILRSDKVASFVYHTREWHSLLTKEEVKTKIVEHKKSEKQSESLKISGPVDWKPANYLWLEGFVEHCLQNQLPDLFRPAALNQYHSHVVCSHKSVRHFIFLSLSLSFAFPLQVVGRAAIMSRIELQSAA